jgi:hypothetical protein
LKPIAELALAGLRLRVWTGLKDQLPSLGFEGPIAELALAGGGLGFGICVSASQEIWAALELSLERKLCTHG